jgi:chromosomal replication initiation ATPase DnaA
MNRTQHLTVQAQIALHAALHRVKPSDITGESKAQRCVIPRKHCFLALVCEPIGHKADGTSIYRSLPQIARYFSDRDHTTVLYGVRSIASKLYGTPVKATLAEIRKAVQVHMDSQTQAAA